MTFAEKPAMKCSQFHSVESSCVNCHGNGQGCRGGDAHGRRVPKGANMTFAEKHNALEIVAYRYTQMNRYWEKSELVNAAWLVERVRTCDNIKHIYQVARQTMISYMRTTDPRGSKKRARVNTQALQVDTGYLIEPTVTPPIDSDFVDQLDWLMMGFSRRYRLIIKLKLEGLFARDIAKVVGDMVESRVNQIYWECLKKMKRKMLNATGGEFI